MPLLVRVSDATSRVRPGSSSVTAHEECGASPRCTRACGHVGCNPSHSVLLPRRVLDKLIREIARSEQQAIEHAAREARRIGDAPPVLALHEVGAHAIELRSRLEYVVVGHELGWPRRTPRAPHRLAVLDPERAFRGALLDLRHGVVLVERLRELARLTELFGIHRWCDDWLSARRTLVARTAAHLAWYVEGIDDPAFSSVATHDPDPSRDSP